MAQRASPSSRCSAGCVPRDCGFEGAEQQGEPERDASQEQVQSLKPPLRKHHGVWDVPDEHPRGREARELWGWVTGAVKLETPSAPREVSEWPCATGGGGDPPPPTKVSVVGKNGIYHKENLIGPFLVHKILGPRPPSPTSNTSLPPPPSTSPPLAFSRPPNLRRSGAAPNSEISKLCAFFSRTLAPFMCYQNAQN